MTDGSRHDEAERRRRNLQAIARHHLHGSPPSPDAENQAAPTAPSPWKKRLATLGPLGVALAFVLGKAKFLIPLLKVTKLSTLLTMFLSMWVYAQFWGAPFAIGFVLLIFVHELGHALVMRQQGLHAGAPVFIPFMGAVIAMKHLPRNAYVEALVGIGGPILGSLGAMACLIIAWLGGSLFWYALAYSGFMINLFNLIPISPLDGGRIVGVVSRWIWGAGYAIGIAVFLTTWSPMLALILLLGLLGLGRAIRGHRPDYYDVESSKRWAIGLAYFGLIGALTLGLQLTQAKLEPMHDEADPAISDGVR